ncbi:MAG: transcriptional regulator, partial [Thermotogaceae bacterium]|nr:transcriptional regulator [Thermotogaceae bacterium]
MRTFCTEGPVDPKLYYYVPRTALIAEGLKKVEQWRYFTIFAPRQSGKTTYFQFLIEAIKREKPDWLPVWVSFEAYGDIELSYFLSSLRDRILRGTELPEETVLDFYNMDDIALKLREVARFQKKEWVIIVDEIEGLKNLKVLNGFLHLIRSIYHEKQAIGLRSVILTGVSNITGIIQDTASPFNIADQIQVPYFTREEVYDLLAQYERETGQLFEHPVKEGIYEQTLGQPGLVNALARDLVEKKCPNGEVVGMDAFYLTVDHFTRVYIDKNISNIVSKAKQHTEIMKEILFGKEVPFNNYDETIKFLYVNGVIDDCDGAGCIPIPLYKKALYTCFKPLFNGEKEHFKSPIETYKKYVDERGLLDVTKLLWRYIAYVKNRGNIIFSQGKASEGVYHYNIDAFFSTYAEFADAKCFVETPVGGGRVDLLLLQAGKTDIIEIKRYDADQYEKS